jgi:two-component system cell cycle response regulator
MSPIFEHTATVTSHEQSLLPQPPLDLLVLSQCSAIYNGDFEVAASQITRTAGIALGVERFSIWLYQSAGDTLNQVDTYLLSQRCHTSGLSIQAADYPDYFEAFTERDWLVISDITDSAQVSALQNFTHRWLEPRNIQALLEVPIRQAGKVVGVVRCEQVGAPRQWQIAESYGMVAIAALTTLALTNRAQKQCLHLNGRHQRYSLLVTDILKAAQTRQDTQQLFSQIVTEVGQTLDADHCLIWNHEPDQPDRFTPLAQYCQKDLSPETCLPDPAKFQRLLDQDIPLLLDTLRDPNANSNEGDNDAVYQLALCATYGGRANGVISLQTRIPCEPEALGVLQTIAAYVGILLAHHHLRNQEEQQLGTLSRQQQQLQREIIERQQVAQAWQESQRFIQSILDASTNILYVNDYTNGQNLYISRWIHNVLGYLPEDVQAMGDFLDQLVHKNDRQGIRKLRRKLSALNNGEIIEMEYRLQHRQGNWRWLLCRETVFQRDESGEPSQIFGTATDITERKQAEDALREVNQELKRLASIDGLTQLANRRSFDEYLQQEWNNLQTTRASLALILCDIDYFKRYNDNYGHQAGDTCLKKVAQAIDQAVKRGFDMVARYGGEEFAIVLPNTTLEGALTVAKNIQKEVKTLQIPHAQSGIGQYITVSLGIAAIDALSAAGPETLIAAADRGLYRAKYEGRDRLCVEPL